MLLILYHFLTILTSFDIFIPGVYVHCRRNEIVKFIWHRRSHADCKMSNAVCRKNEKWSNVD